jgi:hypothetical protein
MVFPLIAAALGSFATGKVVEAGTNLAGDAFKAVLGQNANKPDSNASKTDNKANKTDNKTSKPDNNESMQQFLESVSQEKMGLAYAGKRGSMEDQAMNMVGNAVLEYAKAKTGDGVDFSKTASRTEFFQELDNQARKLAAEGKSGSPEAKALENLTNSMLQQQQIASVAQAREMAGRMGL